MNFEKNGQQQVEGLSSECLKKMASSTLLTAAINTSPEGQAVPSLLDSLFEKEGISTPLVLIEREGNELALVPATERGAPSDVTLASKRDLLPFPTLTPSDACRNQSR